MLKRLHFFVAFLLLAGMVQAQGFRKGGTVRIPEVKPISSLTRYSQPRHQAPRRDAIEVDGDRQMWWGYYKGGGTYLVGLGTSTAETYWAGIAIPPTQSICQEKSIRGVRFIVAGKDYMKDFGVWIADELPSEGSTNYTLISVDMADVNDNDFTEVTLPEPYPISGKTIYVGYTFTITEAGGDLPSNYPCLINYDGQDITGAILLRTTSVTEWFDPSSSQGGYGELCFQVLLDGEFPHNAVEVNSKFNDVFALPGGTAEAAITLTSRGLGKISSIDYIVDEANSGTDELHMDIEPFEGMDAQSVVRIPINADSEPGRTPRSITITKVNGMENTIENAITDGYMVTLSKAVPKKTVVEEFTGTWCGWCPIGITGLEKINAQYPDESITIAIHADDPMGIDYGVNASSYPSALVNRGTVAHPYYGITDEPAGILTLVGDMNKVLAEASVNLQQPTLTKSGNVSFKTDVTFNYSINKSTYALGYVLLADGLTGSGRDWAQANYYCQEEVKGNYADDPDLHRWTEGESYIYPMTYDHVAIAAKGMDGGISGSIKAPIKDGDTRTVNGTLPLEGNTVLQDFEHLSVVAVLFNTATGTIVNADIQPVVIAEDFAVNKMQVKSFIPKTILKGTATDITVPVINYGRAGVKNIDYTVRMGSEESEPKHIELEKPITTFGIETPVNFPIATVTETGYVNTTIIINAVNGEENEATTGKTSNGHITTIAKTSPRKTVVEEFTGTWCMWCPRGLAGLKRARDEYPDDAVLISIHGGSNTEPMQVSAFNTLLSSISGYPSAYVNRYREVDPYMGEGNNGSWGLGTVIEDEQSHLAEAAVNLQQPVLDPETDIINFQTDVTFQLNRTSAPYLLSYVLVADGLHGESDEWLQTNAYAAYYAGSFQDDPYMNEICNIWDIYADVTFNDVAVAANGINTGVTGSLKNVVEEGQVQSHTSKFNIKNNKLAQMATELRVVALLYDKTAKRFINADEKRVVRADDDAVRDIIRTNASQETQRYTLDGKFVRQAVSGINLVRTADGTVRKVLVR